MRGNPCSLQQEAQQDTGGYGRADHPRDVAGHAILQDMILRIILQGNLIRHTAGHRHRTQACSTNQRIDLLLCKEIEYLHKEDTAGDGQRKGQESADHNFAHQQLYLALSTLPPKERAAITLYYLSGYSIKEIAAITEVNADAVKKQLSRGRDRLKQLIKP